MDREGGAGWDRGDRDYGYSRDVAWKPDNMEGWTVETRKQDPH